MSTQKNRILIGVGVLNILATIYVSVQPFGLEKDKLSSKLFELYTASVAGLWGAFAMQDRITIAEESTTDKDKNQG